ncbi:MAG: PqqD family protein [Faecalibacillus intestinalis]
MKYCHILIQKLKEEYHIDHTLAQSDVEKFIKILQEKNMLEV